MDPYNTRLEENHDPVTGLLAAPLFMSQSQRAARESCRRAAPLSVIGLSFDPADAADWYDLESHDLLRGAARYVRAALRAEYFFARTGNAFVIVMPRTDVAQALSFARLVVSGGLSLQLQDSTVDVAGYAGVATVEHWRDPVADLRNAIVGGLSALTVAWRSGPSSVVAYTSGMGSSERRQSQIARDFPRAISSGQLALLYQPIVDTSDGRVTAVEALVRWRHPHLHLVGPAEFVPVAERLGYGAALNEWVLTQALSDFATMRASAPALMLHVNMCPVHLAMPGAGTDILSWIRETGVPPETIVLEITENAGERSYALETNIAQLRCGGVKIAVDDIGRGFNTLLFFAEVPCDAVKVDRALVPCQADDVRRQEIFSSLRAGCDRLGVTLIAEGVETKQQHDYLAGSGVRFAQGYHYGFPMPASALPLRS